MAPDNRRPYQRVKDGDPVDVFYTATGGVGNAIGDATAPELTRWARMREIERMLGRRYCEHLRKPNSLDQQIWDAIRPRLAVNDLLTPVLTAIVSATYGGKITRRINKARNKNDLERYMKLSRLDHVMKSIFTQGAAYGTSYGWPGWTANDYPKISILPSTRTTIRTAPDDVDEISAIDVQYTNIKRIFRDNAIYETVDGKRRVVPDSNFGFVPVQRFMARHLDPLSPYGEDLVWPAACSTRQTTFLKSGIMILAQVQTYSTMVVQGRPQQDPKEQASGPFMILRLDPNDPNAKAYYISPDAKISELTDLIEDDYERCAAQCSVPVSILTNPKSGTNVGTGAAYLSHKPLYDLAISLQEDWREYEISFLAMMDAMLDWRKNGHKPVNLQDYRDYIEADIVYENESNPALTLPEAQTYEMLVDSCFVSHETAYYHFNPKGTDVEQKKLQAERDSRNKVDVQTSLQDNSTRVIPMDQLGKASASAADAQTKKQAA